MPASDAARAAAGSSARASSRRTRSVSTRPGISPTTRPPVGPSSSASCLTSMPRPGRRPFEVASPGSGPRTDVESTQATARSDTLACATTARLTRRAARNTLSNAVVHCSSDVSSTEPGGGPPTLTRAPSSRPNARRATSEASSPTAGSDRLAGTATARSSPSSATASDRTSARRATSTTRAPSPTSRVAVARPRPPLAAVTTKTRSARPRSIGSDPAGGELGPRLARRLALVGGLAAAGAALAQVAADEHDDAGRTDPGEHEPLDGVPEVGAVGDLWQRDRREAAGLGRVDGEQTDVAVRHGVGQRRADGLRVDQPHRAVDRNPGRALALLVAPYLPDHRHLAGRRRRRDRRDLRVAGEGDDAAVDQHGPARGAQRRHDLETVGVAAAAVAEHVLVVGVEGPGRADPLPLVGVGDRPREDLGPGPDGLLLVAHRRGVALAPRVQPVELPVPQERARG